MPDVTVVAASSALICQPKHGRFTRPIRACNSARLPDSVWARHELLSEVINGLGKKFSFAHFFAWKTGPEQSGGINRIGPRRYCWEDFRKACRWHVEACPSLRHCATEKNPRTEARDCAKGRVGWKELPELCCKTESGELVKARSTMRALLTLAPLKSTEDRLTVPLNWR